MTHLHPSVEQYELQAVLWKRESTDEWVLQLEGTINDTSFIVRHPQPATVTPEDAISLREPHFTVDELAQEIRKVDGQHKLGAGALAEALMPFLRGQV